MNNISIRNAQAEDAEALLAIYAPYVLENSTSYEYELPSTEAFAERIKAISSDYPYLVCEKDGKAVGYAYAHRHQQREGYKYSAETTVYVSIKHQKEGIGSMLYAELLERLRSCPVRNLYAAVNLPNDGSVALHKKFGFKEAGLWENCGYKFGEWHSVIWFELTLNENFTPEVK